MEYQAPLGSADPNASYVQGNPAAGVRGSYVPALAIEQPMRELLAVIAADPSLVPSNTESTQVLEAIRYLIATAIAAIPPVQIPAIPTYGATGEGGLAKDPSNDFLLAFANLVANTPALTDLFAGLKVGGAHYQFTGAQLVAFIAANLPSEPGAITTVDLALESVTAFRNLTVPGDIAGVGNNTPITVMTFNFSVPEAGPALITYSALVGFSAGPQGMIIEVFLDGNVLIQQIGGTAGTYYPSNTASAFANLAAGAHTIVATFNSPAVDVIYDQSCTVLLGAR